MSAVGASTEREDPPLASRNPNQTASAPTEAAAVVAAAVCRNARRLRRLCKRLDSCPNTPGAHGAHSGGGFLSIAIRVMNSTPIGSAAGLRAHRTRLQPSETTEWYCWRDSSLQRAVGRAALARHCLAIEDRDPPSSHANQALRL